MRNNKPHLAHFVVHKMNLLGSCAQAYRRKDCTRYLKPVHLASTLHSDHVWHHRLTKMHVAGCRESPEILVNVCGKVHVKLTTKAAASGSSASPGWVSALAQYSWHAAEKKVTYYRYYVLRVNKHLCWQVSWHHDLFVWTGTSGCISIYTPCTAAPMVSMASVLFWVKDSVCVCTTYSTCMYAAGCLCLPECIWIHVIKCECVCTGAWYRKERETSSVCKNGWVSSSECVQVWLCSCCWTGVCSAWVNTVINAIYLLLISSSLRLFQPGHIFKVTRVCLLATRLHCCTP